MKLTYEQAIARAELPTYTVDWGRSRGQGKRSGGGQVRGAMADPPRGVKTYSRPSAARGVTPEVWEAIRFMEDEDRSAVIGALQAGARVDDALRLGFGALREVEVPR